MRRAMRNTRINFRHFSEAFWKHLRYSTGEAVNQAREELRSIYIKCDEYREKASYKTESISFDMMQTLFALGHYYQFARVCEVGTFIGRSTLSLAIHADIVWTCDKDNDCLPQVKNVITHPKQTATQMFHGLCENNAQVDFFFLDGRLEKDDLALIGKLVHANTVFCFDDFCGVEKGVINVAVLTGQYPSHILIEPEANAQIALMIPADSVELTRQ